MNYKHARGLDSWQALAGEGCGRHFTLWEKQTLKKLRRDSLSPSSHITTAPQQQALSDTNHTKCPLSAHLGLVTAELVLVILSTCLCLYVCLLVCLSLTSRGLLGKIKNKNEL